MKGEKEGDVVQGPGHTYLINTAGYPWLDMGYPRRSDSPRWRPGAWVPRRTARSPWAGAEPGSARETVGTQGGGSFPSWGPAKVTVPQAAQVPICQVPHSAGDGPTPAEMPLSPTRLEPLSLCGVDYTPLLGDLQGIRILADIPWPPRTLQPHHHALRPQGM